MEIDFKNKKLRKQLTEEKLLVKKYGKVQAKRIEQRLSEIEATPTLDELKQLPGPRLHPLKENRKGQLCVDLDQPYRLIFVPNHDPIPQLRSGGLDWKAITKVKIFEIADTHE